MVSKGFMRMVSDESAEVPTNAAASSSSISSVGGSSWTDDFLAALTEGFLTAVASTGVCGLRDLVELVGAGPWSFVSGVLRLGSAAGIGDGSKVGLGGGVGDWRDFINLVGTGFWSFVSAVLESGLTTGVAEVSKAGSGRGFGENSRASIVFREPKGSSASSACACSGSSGVDSGVRLVGFSGVW